MSSNFLPPQNNQNNSPGERPRRTGLLSGYAAQMSQFAPPSLPGNGANPTAPAPQNVQRPPTGNLPNQPGSQGQFPPQWNGPAFMARPLQMVQRWSNKMTALRRSGPPVDPNPLVLHRSPQPPTLP